MILYERKHNRFLHKGSPVCQNFKNKHFYYTSCVKNCVFDCSYCFLKGMYEFRDIVVYTNLEDYFKTVDEKLKQIPAGDKLYLCVSFDTDLMPLEDKLHYIKRWCNYAKDKKIFNIEIRTKGHNLNSSFWEEIVNDNSIFAFTLSPQSFISLFENGTSNIKKRLSTIELAQKHNAKVRLCFDPIIYKSGWEDPYENLIENTFKTIDKDKIQDVSIGTFRISKTYLKNMRRLYPNNVLAQFPYILKNGYYQYDEWIVDKLESFILDKLSNYIDRDKIFNWH